MPPTTRSTMMAANSSRILPQKGSGSGSLKLNKSSAKDKNPAKKKDLGKKGGKTSRREKAGISKQRKQAMVLVKQFFFAKMISNFY